MADYLPTGDSSRNLGTELDLPSLLIGAGSTGL